MLKKIGSFLLIAVMLMAVLTPLTIVAAQSGQCGDNLIWVLDDSGTLTISGTGDMWDWESNSAPWGSVKTSVKRVVINSGVTSIGLCAFDSCINLSSIRIPLSVTKIESGAFYECVSLTSINIPSGIADIKDGAFLNCKNLIAVNVDVNNRYYCDVNGVLFTNDRRSLCAYPGGKKETSYEIPNGVTFVGYGAFTGCDSLATISIPSSVTYIGEYAIAGCTNLISIIVNVNNMNYCDIDGVLLSKDKKKIYVYPAGRKEQFYAIPKGVTDIGRGVFFDCDNLTTVSIPSSVMNIWDEAFYDCNNLVTMSIPSSVTYIDAYGLLFCGNLKNIYYAGSEAMWKTLAMNAAIPDTIKIHYNSVAPGTIIGSALRTDIKAEINGHAIPSFNVDGYTYIMAEDLKGYGFFVHYDDTSRTLAVNRDYSKTTVTRNYVKPYVPKSEVGMKEYDLVATDIVTYLDNNYVQSYNINGQTIIPFNELGRYGEVYYDEGSRTITAIIPGLN